MKKTQQRNLYAYAENLIRNRYGIEPEDCDLDEHVSPCEDLSEVEEVVDWIGDKYNLDKRI